MQRYKLTLSYDGSRYLGWQRLKDSDQTIQGKIENVLSRFDDGRVEVDGSGRTDAGVHAKGQVASFCLKKETDCATLLDYLRQFLPEDIGALSVEKVSERFHARLNVKRKTYCYFLWTDPAPCVFERKYLYVFREKLNIEAMQKAAAILCGTHDFGAFCSNKHIKKSTVRTMEKITVEKSQHGICIRMTADGFLYHMARIIVGTLLEVGKNLRSAESVENLFMGSREDAGFTAPAKGLCLMEVEY